MSRSKKIFAAFALAFIIILAYVVYDISSRTTFPGSRAPSTTQEGPVQKVDSTREDSIR